METAQEKHPGIKPRQSIDVDDELPLSHARSFALPPTSLPGPTVSPLSAGIDDEPSLAGVGTAPSRKRLILVGVGLDNESVASDLANGMFVVDEVSKGLEEPPEADPLPTDAFYHGQYRLRPSSFST